MATAHHEYYEHQKVPITIGYVPSKEDDKDGINKGIIYLITRVLRMVAATAAGVAVGGPLFVAMGISVAVSASLALIGLPLMLIFSPLLVLAIFMLGTATAGFSLASVIASGSLSALNWVFRSTPTQEEQYEEDDATSKMKMLVEGWKPEQQQQQQHKQQMKEKDERVDEQVQEEEEATTTTATARERDEPQKEDVTADADNTDKKSKKQKNPKKK